MSVDPPVVQAIYAFSTVSAVVIGAIIWQYRTRPGSYPLLVMISGSLLWALLLFLTTLTPSFEISALLIDLVMFAASIGTIGYFLFALEYTGREQYITSRSIAIAALVPVVTLAITLADPGGAFYDYLVADPSHATGVAFEYGPLFWVLALTHYVLLLVAAAIIIGMVYRTRAMYKGQVVALVGSVAAALSASLISNLGFVPFDVAPIGLVIANGLLVVAVTRYHLIDLSPIARSFVLEEISDGVLVVDSQHRIVDVNAAGAEMLTRMLGARGPRDAGVTVGQPMSELLGGHPTIEAQYWETIEERTQQDLELTVNERYYSLTASPLDDGRGRHVGWLFLFRDVTERKRREDELRRRNEQLEQFASVVSHDLRNPLGIAKGYVELVGETGELELLGEVEEAHERMETIIEDVLALAREGSTVTDPDSVDLGSAAERAWGNVETGRAALRVADGGPILADGDRLARLLENLYRNAIEHGVPDDNQDDGDRNDDGNPADDGNGADDGDDADDGEVAITVEVGRVDGGFYVEDDGVGIPQAEREQVFESGYSGGGGTGFGLSIVQQIAEAHGWTVSVRDGTDGGARFEIEGVSVPKSE
jgi:PAS domain S-box-containing protein